MAVFQGLGAGVEIAMLVEGVELTDAVFKPTRVLAEDEAFTFGRGRGADTPTSCVVSHVEFPSVSRSHVSLVFRVGVKGEPVVIITNTSTSSEVFTLRPGQAHDVVARGGGVIEGRCGVGYLIGGTPDSANTGRILFRLTGLDDDELPATQQPDSEQLEATQVEELHQEVHHTPPVYERPTSGLTSEVESGAAAATTKRASTPPTAPPTQHGGPASACSEGVDGESVKDDLGSLNTEDRRIVRTIRAAAVVCAGRLSLLNEVVAIDPNAAEAKSQFKEVAATVIKTLKSTTELLAKMERRGTGDKRKARAQAARGAGVDGHRHSSSSSKNQQGWGAPKARERYNSSGHAGDDDQPPNHYVLCPHLTKPCRFEGRSCDFAHSEDELARRRGSNRERVNVTVSRSGKKRRVDVDSSGSTPASGRGGSSGRRGRGRGHHGRGSRGYRGKR